MKQIMQCTALLCLAVSLFEAQPMAAQEPLTEVSLEQLLDEALRANPNLKASEHAWLAARQREAQVSSLPDPVFSFTRFGSSVETRVGPQENVLMLTQPIPFPGKLGLKGQIAQQQAVVEQQSFEITKRDLTFAVKTAYYDLLMVDRSLEILDEYLDRLNGFTRIAEQKYATGRGSQASVFKSQVESSSIMDRRLGFLGNRSAVVARINALLNRPADSALGQAADFEKFDYSIDEQQLVALATSQRQELAAVRAQIASSEFRKRVAKKETWPDFRLQANYITISPGMSSAADAGKDAWSVMLGLNLPIWLGKRKAARQEADELLTANTLRYENLANHVATEIHDLVSRIEISVQSLKLYEQGLLTQAESSLRSTLAGYQAGQVDFLNLLDSERMLLGIRLAYVKEQTNYHKQLASLERAVGGELP